MNMSQIEPARDEIPGPAPVLGYAGLPPPPTVAVVWCRIFALWLLANGLTDGAGFVGYVASRLISSRVQYQVDIAQAAMFSSILPCAVFLLMAWYCWRKAPALARRMAAGSDPGSSQHGIASNELLHLVLIGIGIYLLTTGIPNLAWLVLYLVISILRNGSPQIPEIDRYVITSAVSCGLGLWLILGTRGIARLVRSHSGRWHDESEIRNPSDESNPKSE
jgi:hypothetical protein